MRKIIIFMLAVALLVSIGHAMAQETGPKPGDQPQTPSLIPGGQPQPPVMGSMPPTQLMQQMQDTMQQMQGMMRKPKLTTAEMKQLQDMLNQMQGMMNQIQIMTIMQMCGSCPMMKQTLPTSSTQPQTGPGTSPSPGSPSEPTKQ